MNAVMEGVDELVANLFRSGEDTKKKAAAALYQEAELIMTRSKRDFVPFDSGDLRDSGTVSLPVITADEITVEMGFGGVAAAYALAVHEFPDRAVPPSWKGKDVGDIKSVRTRTPWSEVGRGPKYLERPFNDAAAGMIDRLAESMK